MEQWRSPGPNTQAFRCRMVSPCRWYTTAPGWLSRPFTIDCPRMEAPPPCDARRNRQPRALANGAEPPADPLKAEHRTSALSRVWNRRNRNTCRPRSLTRDQGLLNLGDAQGLVQPPLAVQVPRRRGVRQDLPRQNRNGITGVNMNVAGGVPDPPVRQLRAGRRDHQVRFDPNAGFPQVREQTRGRTQLRAKVQPRIRTARRPSTANGVLNIATWNILFFGYSGLTVPSR